MWTPADRALVREFGSGQALTDDQFRLLEPLIPPAKPGGRPRTTDTRKLLDGLFYLVRTGCTAPGSLDTRLHYAARLRFVSRRAARAASGLR
jgi:hypothetical protein